MKREDLIALLREIVPEDAHFRGFSLEFYGTREQLENAMLILNRAHHSDNKFTGAETIQAEVDFLYNTLKFKVSV